jgi:MoxR-like ATPase
VNTLQIKMKLIALPIATVLGAYDTYCPSAPALRGPASDQKNQAVDALVVEVENHHVTVTDISLATPRTPVVSAGLDPAAVQAIQAASSMALDTAQRAVKASLNTSAELATVLGKMASLESSLINERDTRTRLGNDLASKVNDSLDKLDRKIGSFAIDDRKVDAAVAKIVADAFKPFEQAVQAAHAQAVVADLASVRVINAKPCLEAFGVEVLDRKGDPLMVDIWNDPTAPAVDLHFIWTADILQHLLLSQDTGENVWFGGPKGTGKSETARQFAAFTGRAFKRINFHKYTSAEDYIGAVGLENGQTVFKRGDFLSAFTHPSTVILLDEVTNADPGELAPLNGFLEPNSAVSFGGSVHTRAPGVLVFAADNTLGNGDDTGRYAGTRQMNSALVDRFARVIPFDYLGLGAEVEAVVRHTGCDPKLAEHILHAVRVARSQVHSGEVIDAPSIRSVIAFIRALRVLSVYDAWATTIAARQPAESLPGLSAIYESCISETQINNYL